MELREIDKLKNLVRTGKVGAITLDTSIFDAQGLRLESGLLKQLEQFRDSATKFILSEIVKKETISHLTEKAKEAHSNIDKSLKQAKEHWHIKDEELEKIKNSIFGDYKAQEFTFERFSNFEKATSLQIINAQDNVMIGDLIEKYFQAKPPFSETGKKKNEFPDAIALISLENWANKNKTKICVVSSDNDWKNFCDGSDILIYVDDFAVALGLFQLQDADDICRYLSERYEKGELDNVQQAITNALEYKISDIDISPEANSGFYWELESTEISLNDFEFTLIDHPNIIFRPVNLDDNMLVVESKLSIDVNIECSFSFSVWDSIDRDYVSMGSSSNNIQTNLDVDILVSFVGDLNKIGAEFEVNDVEIEMKTPDVIDFGEVEPDWIYED